jgi:hypothetical protein
MEDGAMQTGDMLFLGLVVAVFVTFSVALAWVARNWKPK